MRKFLSLVLALVMMMSLVTINVGAKEFTDGDDITYQEAVDVISTIHVVDGYNDGDFKPGNNLSRGAAAKIICNMILGPTTAAELHADTAPYRDVPVTSDFAGYIAYCQKEGIISGYADGTFRPAGTLTGYAFMKMLLGALGYDAEIEGYTGPNWSINVAKRAIGIGLNASLEKTFNGVEFVTREEAALYAFNTLKADLVEYDTKITATVNGAEVTVGNSIAEPQKWNSQMTRNNNIYNDTTIQFAEQYFNKLVLTEAEDVFGRPDREWAFEGEDIGAYINYDLLKEEYTVEVTGKELRDLIGGSIVDDKDYTFNITVDGETEKAVLDQGSGLAPYFTRDNLIRTNTKGVGATGKGVLTQVFVNSDTDANRGGKTVWIAIINTYLAKATDDYNEKKEEADFDVYGVDNVEPNNRAITLVKNTGDSDTVKNGKQPYVENLTVDNEDINVEEVKENDFFLVHVADGKIQEMLDPETVESTISSFKNGDWVKAESTQYDYDNTALYDPDVLDQYDQNNMKDTNYRIFLDEYGYAIAIEIIDEPDQYVFLTGINGKTSNIAKKTAEGNVIHLDGTMETVEIDMDKSQKVNDGTNSKWSKWNVATDLTGTMNTWCKYSVNANGVYTLTEIAKTNASYATAKNKTGQGSNTDTGATVNDKLVTLDKSHITLNGIQENASSAMKRVYGNDDSIFIMAEVSEIPVVNLASNPGYGGDAVIIDNVASVTTGVRNVNLKAWNAAKVQAYGENGSTAFTPTNIADVSNGVYTLFNDKGFVIAAVIVGEDDGTTTNYAFTHKSTMKQEDYNKDGDKWVWYRDVIVNGVETTLVERGSSKPAIGDMVFGEWYEVKYNADGEVRSATPLCNKVSSSQINYTNGNNLPANDFGGYASPYPNSNGTKYVRDMNDVEKALENKNTVLLWQDLSDRNHSISVVANSLQIDNSTNSVITRGIDLSPDAKTALIQDEYVDRNQKPTALNALYEYENGGTGAAKAVKHLNGNFRGYVGAVFENGVATSVVLWDRTPTYVNTGWNGGGGGGSTETFPQVTDRTGSAFTVEYYDDTYVDATHHMSDQEIADTVAGAVGSYLGYNVINARMNALGTTVNAELDDGQVLHQQITITPKRVIAVTLNDTTVLGYARADGATAVTTGAGRLKALDNTKAYLVGANTKATSPDVAVGSQYGPVTPAATASDIKLYTAYAITLNGSVSADYTDLAGNAANLATGSTYYVAEGTQLTLKKTLTGDNLRHQFTENGSGIGTSLVASAATTLTESYIVSKTATIDEATGVQIFINDYEFMANPGTTTFDDLIEAGHVSAGRVGKWLVDLDETATDGSNGDDASTTTSAVTTAFLKDGHHYDFGYYKVTMPASLTTIAGDAIAGATLTWAVTDVTTPAGGAQYFLKTGSTVEATFKAATVTAAKDNATIAGGAGAVAAVVSATPNAATEALTGAAITAATTTVTIAKDTSVYTDVELTFTWTVATADIAASVLTVTVGNA